jgi:hypothetical protein
MRSAKQDSNIHLQQSALLSMFSGLVGYEPLSWIPLTPKKIRAPCNPKAYKRCIRRQIFRRFFWQEQFLHTCFQTTKVGPRVGLIVGLISGPPKNGAVSSYPQDTAVGLICACAIPNLNTTLECSAIQWSHKRL